jgi:UDP-N-acetylglucosamine 2-epimerase (non-hydrolysing)
MLNLVDFFSEISLLWGLVIDGSDENDILNILNLKENNFFVVSIHREENIEPLENFTKIVKILNVIAENYNLPVLVSTHPRTQKIINQTNFEFHKNIQLLKPLGFRDYVKLELSARATLSDSGTINEEASILNFPALNLREVHERPEGMDEGTVIMSGIERNRVLESVNIILQQFSKNPNSIRIINDYNVDNVSTKVVRIILSYIDFVNLSRFLSQ